MNALRYRLANPRFHPSAILLAAQLAGVVLYAFVDADRGRALLSLFGLVVLVLVARAVERTPALTWISILLGVPIIVLLAVQLANPSDNNVLLALSILLAAYYLYASYALVRYMFHDAIVTPDELYATGATFTVLAWGFAYVFLAVQAAWPASFTGPGEIGVARSFFELLFLSFTTLTSVGLSDIVPVSSQARSMVMIEEVIGLMYVAIVISRVVALTVARQRFASVRPVASTTQLPDADDANPTT
ncbi:MAG TPA: potassium channel family protein [Candidatus Limnocylindrales bacterium]|jgi:hypothetical protein